MARSTSLVRRDRHRLSCAEELKEVPTARELVLATDASYIEHSLFHSAGYIATNGRWGIDASRYTVEWCKPHCVPAMELRAVWYGLRVIEEGTPLRIWTDSMDAATQLRNWQDGEMEMPSWYSMAPRGYLHPEGVPTFVSLRNRLQQDAEAMRIDHVKGHNGNLLNEAADSLAGIGTNYLRREYGKVEARRRGASLVASFLASYALESV